MRFLLYFSFLIILAIFPCKSLAQNANDISTHLQQTGRVILIQDARLTQLAANAHNKSAHAQMTANGYRIRVYSGNKQNVSKKRAYDLERQIQDADPEISTYVTFKTPNWRLLVGDFNTAEEAVAVLKQLRDILPEQRNEMFVIKDKINL